MEAGSVEGILALSKEISARDVRIKELEISLETLKVEADNREKALLDEL